MKNQPIKDDEIMIDFGEDTFSKKPV